MLRVVRRIGSAKHCFDRVVFDELFERVVGLLAAARLRQTVAAVGKEIAYCHHFDIGMILESKSRPELAEAIADNTHTYLSIRNGFPALRRCRTCSNVFFESLNR